MGSCSAMTSLMERFDMATLLLSQRTRGGPGLKAGSTAVAKKAFYSCLY